MGFHFYSQKKPTFNLVNITVNITIITIAGAVGAAGVVGLLIIRQAR